MYNPPMQTDHESKAVNPWSVSNLLTITIVGLVLAVPLWGVLLLLGVPATYPVVAGISILVCYKM